MFDETVLAEAIAEQVAVALGLFRPEGDLNDRQWAQAQTLVWRKSLQSLSNFSRIGLLNVGSRFPLIKTRKDPRKVRRHPPHWSYLLA